MSDYIRFVLMAAAPKLLSKSISHQSRLSPNLERRIIIDIHIIGIAVAIAGIAAGRIVIAIGVTGSSCLRIEVSDS